MCARAQDPDRRFRVQGPSVPGGVAVAAAPAACWLPTDLARCLLNRRISEADAWWRLLRRCGSERDLRRGDGIRFVLLVPEDVGHVTRPDAGFRLPGFRSG